MINLSFGELLHKQLPTIFSITAVNIIIERSFKAAFEVS